MHLQYMYIGVWVTGQMADGMAISSTHAMFLLSAHFL